MHVERMCKNLVQTRLGGEFWTSDVITHKAYYKDKVGKLDQKDSGLGSVNTSYYLCFKIDKLGPDIRRRVHRDLKSMI